MSIWEFCIKRPIFTTVLMASLILVGIMGYNRMGVDLMPDFDVPVVVVTTTYIGADPEVMDQDITDVIEERVGTLEGIDSIRSTSFESYSSIVIEFDLERNIDVATQEVRDKVSAALQDLPDGIEQPIVQKVDPDSQPIMYMTLTGSVPYQQLSLLADDVLKERLQNINGVGNVVMNGFRERNIRIWLSPKGMEKYDLGPVEVLNALSNWHVELPGGRVENETSEFTIKMEGEYPTIDELENLCVAWKDGAQIRLKDLATIEDGEEDVRSMARYDGKEAIMLGVTKQSGQNTVAIAKAVREKMPEFQSVMPKGVRLVMMYDTSEFIQDSVQGVGHDLLIGGVITALVIFLFLRHIKMTMISMISIPTSLVGAFGFMYFMGFTVNQITMLAMSLAVGLVIDDTIVVLENIFRQIEEGQDDSKLAAASGTREVAFAVFAATLTIAAIFLPVAFMGGVIGRIFYQFGITIGVAISLSYIVSITLTPMLCGRFLKKEVHEGYIARFFGSLLEWLETTYAYFLEICLRNRFTRVCVLLVALAAFAAGLGLTQLVGTEFSPNADRSAFLISIETPIGTSLTTTNERCKQVEKIVAAHKEVRDYGCMVGNATTGQINTATVIVELLKTHQRTKTQQQIMDEMREELKVLPGITCYPSHIPQMGGGGSARQTDLTFVVQGPVIETLEKISSDLIEKMKQDPDLRDPDDDLELIQPQVSVYPNRDSAADVKMNTRQIAVAVQAMMGGVDAAKFKIDGKRYDIRVKADDSFRVSSDAIRNIILRTPSGDRIELGRVADVVEGLGPYSIKRYDRMRSVTISANVLPGVPVGDASDKFEKEAKEYLKDYPGYKIVPSGMTKVQQESMGYMMFALFSSVFIIYLVLAAQFESFIHPFTIMMTLPLTIVGVFLALFITGNTFNVFSIIGLIMLVGIVTRNGILLVEFANQKREEGLNAHHAMLAAGKIRLRPILMTAVSSMGGVVPVALGMSEGGEVRAGMGVAVIGGLLTSTFLTIFVVPVAYLTFEGTVRNIGYVYDKLFGGKGRDSATTRVELPVQPNKESGNE